MAQGQGQGRHGRRRIVILGGGFGGVGAAKQLEKADVKLPMLLKRKPGDPHPYVVGPDVVKAYLTVAAECSAAAQLLPDEYNGYMGR